MSQFNEIEDWNRIASTYSELRESGNEFEYEEKSLWSLLGDVTNQNVLDLACGQGGFCSELTRKGAHVVGVDGSIQLLTRARSLYPKIEFIEHDLAEGLPHFQTEFHIVMSRMAVMDIRDIRSFFNDVPGVLRSDGRFIFTLLHPCFWNQKSHLDEQTGEWFKKVNGYLDFETWRVESFGGHNHYHRPMSYYFDALTEAGMAVTRLLEPRHEGTGKVVPVEFSGKFPLYLMIEAVKM